MRMYMHVCIRMRAGLIGAAVQFVGHVPLRSVHLARSRRPRQGCHLPAPRLPLAGRRRGVGRDLHIGNPRLIQTVAKIGSASQAVDDYLRAEFDR